MSLIVGYWLKRPDERVPLLERVKFLAIVSSNLDEFFMKRIGGLKQQVGAGLREPTVDGLSPQQQIEACYRVVREIELEQRLLFRHLKALLSQSGIEVISYDQLDAGTAGQGARTLPAQYLSAGDAAGDGSGTSVSVRFQFVP